LPALIHIDNQITPPGQRLGPNVLVLSPTRELAIQIEQEVKKINYKGIKSLCGKLKLNKLKFEPLNFIFNWPRLKYLKQLLFFLNFFSLRWW